MSWRADNRAAVIFRSGDPALSLSPALAIGAPLVFPPGTHEFDTPLTISTGTLGGIEGSGPALTTLRYTGSGPAIIVEPSYDGAAYWIQHYLRNFKLDGGGIEVDGAHFCDLSNLWIVNDADGAGLWLHGDAQDTSINNVHIQNCLIGLQVGTEGDSNDGAKQTRASNLRVNQNTQNDCLLYYAQTFNWAGGLIQGTGGTGLAGEGVARFEWCEALSLQAIHVEHTAADPSLKFYRCTNTTVQGCRITQASGDPRRLVNAELCVGFCWLNNRQALSSPNIALEVNNTVGACIIDSGGYQALPVNVVAGPSPAIVNVLNPGGLATFTGASTKAVSFAATEPDANYGVLLGGEADENFWVTSKATSGFTLNSSNASSTATVRWELRR